MPMMLMLMLMMMMMMMPMPMLLLLLMLMLMLASSFIGRVPRRLVLVFPARGAAGFDDLPRQLAPGAALER